jgi:DNA-binding winged helix-turn-helix (wHTH) protein/tetratricopeptide (TPR) repeat protein
MSEISSVFRFGNYRLSPATRELYRSGTLIQLSPRMFDCLVWLFEHRGRAVGRDELSAAVWGRVDITDAQIDQLIRKVRRVLGDTGSHQEIIRTIPRFGYRWVADVREEPAFDAPAMPDVQPEITGVAPEPAVTSAPVKSSRGFRRRAAIAVGLTLLVVGSVLTLLFTIAGRDTDSTDARRLSASDAAVGSEQVTGRVAVIPVAIDDDLGTEWAWLRLGLMDLISARLREGGLTVVPASNIIALVSDRNASAVDPATVQIATDARIIVSPSVKKTGNGWRMHLELRGMNSAVHEMATHGDDAISSARAAADRLLVLLGKSPVVNASPGGSEEDALIYIDAALDGRDYAAAKKLLDEVPPGLRDNPALRLRRAEVERVAGNNAVAKDIYESLLDSDRQVPLSPWLKGATLLSLATVLAQENRMVEAKVFLNEAIDLSKVNDLQILYGTAMKSRAALHIFDGRHADADGDFAQARVALELAGDVLSVAMLEAAQAGGLTLRNRYVEAGLLLDQAISRMQRFPPREDLITALGSRISIQLALLNVPEALAVVEQTMAEIARGDESLRSPFFRFQEARALIGNGRLVEGRRILAEMTEGVDERRMSKVDLDAMISLAELELMDLKVRESGIMAERVVQSLQAPEFSSQRFARTRMNGWLLHVRARHRLGAVDEAAADVERFSAWAIGQDDTAATAYAHLAQAEQAAAEHHAEAAIASFQSALTAASTSLVPADIAKVVISYGNYLIESGHLDEATRIVGQVSRWSGQDFNCALLQVRLFHALHQHEAWKQALGMASSLAGERTIPESLTIFQPNPTPSAD